ncbi:hypothetical protein BDY19DRAFT_1045279 [Irpex rosettiformis]|uniref:Uncharacterized protein n=1 Tax=Irpex rosettiformis TaxID=378272 RepID=A0ACB8UF93_9APHY|nr:hypothetical protein BDY19DRAFT_1045279 [Irpex rosettiformis]
MSIGGSPMSIVRYYIYESESILSPGKIAVSVIPLGCINEPSVSSSSPKANFWGAVRVSREAIRFFRDENPNDAGGRLIVNSSIGGLNAFGGVGFYSATKYASEAIHQALAQEIDPNWNIKISIVEPGNFRTEVWGPAAARLSVPEIYSTPTAGYAKTAEYFTQYESPDFKMGDTRKGSQKVYNLATLTDPPLRLVLGQDAIDSARGQLEAISVDLAAYESWSSDVAES